MMIETDIYSFVRKELTPCYNECPSCMNLLKIITKNDYETYLICEGCYYIKYEERCEGSSFYKLTRKQFDHVKKNFYKDE